MVKIYLTDVPFINSVVMDNKEDCSGMLEELFGVEGDLFERFRVNGFVEVEEEEYNLMLREREKVSIESLDYNEFISLWLLEMWGVYYSFES